MRWRWCEVLTGNDWVGHIGENEGEGEPENENDGNRDGGGDACDNKSDGGDNNAVGDDVNVGVDDSVEGDEHTINPSSECPASETNCSLVLILKVDIILALVSSPLLFPIRSRTLARVFSLSSLNFNLFASPPSLSDPLSLHSLHRLAIFSSNSASFSLSLLAASFNSATFILCSSSIVSMCSC